VDATLRELFEHSSSSVERRVETLAVVETDDHCVA
jgi:hypothetical protein